MDNVNETLPEAAGHTAKKAVTNRKRTGADAKKATAKKTKPKAVKKTAPAKISGTKEKGSKIKLREQIANTLATTFAGLKDVVGEKKFNRRIEKASKILAAGAEKKTKDKKEKAV